MSATTFLADLHIHSPYSRATSPSSTLAGLCAWARVKGISVLGTGDFTHPSWFRLIRECLVPAEPGLFRLRDEGGPSALPGVRPEGIPVRFLLSTEISCIYKRHGRVRKVHHVLFVPDLATAERLNTRLARLGNIESDGRPILGLDSRDLLEILLTCSDEAFLVPAHIWTPWFSLFGSKSGFDTVEECFADLTPHIFALETGLSSDPAMNRLVSQLDRFALISNSDCHSPSKLGREVNLFATPLDFFAMRDSLKDPAGGGFQGTLEFFPEEGKYHNDGHRQCRISLDPLATRLLDSLCPVCGRPLTIGVNHRVLELADREQPHSPPGQPGFASIVPLPEVLGEILGQGPATKKVEGLYAALISQFGAEFTLLRRTPLEEISRLSPVLAEAIRRIRVGQVIRQAGYDGEFGRILVFQPGEIAEFAGQESLFARPKRAVKAKAEPVPLPPLPDRRRAPPAPSAPALNPEQEEAVRGDAARLLVVAGPGTGKTHTLSARIRQLVEGRGVPAAAIAAITFTNRAAREIEERLARQGIEGVFVGTLHRFCLHWLRQDQPQLGVAGDDDREHLLRGLFPQLRPRERDGLRAAIAEHGRLLNTSPAPPAASPQVRAYLTALARQGLMEIEQIIPCLLARLRAEPGLRARLVQCLRHLLVDEFQDLNLAQYQLLRQLLPEVNLFAIGDPDQAIYGFRGSDPAFFAALADNRDLEGTTQVIALRHNYRSAPAILEAASTLIQHNRQRRPTVLLPHSPGPGSLEFHRSPSPQAEAEFVVQRLEELMGGVCHFSMDSGRGGGRETGLSFADFAICYRLNSQAEPLLQALNRRGIPAQVVGSPPFFLSHGLRPLYYLVQAAAGDATPAEYLLLCQGAGLSGQAMARLQQLSVPAGNDFLAAAQDAAGLAKAQTARLGELHLLRQRLRDDAEKHGLAATLAAACLPLLGVDPEAAQRFLELAGLFGGGLAAFADHLRDNAQGVVYDRQAEAVSLLSLHAAKGLEFSVVFLCGLEEGVLPHLPPGREADIEEERRLFYVGLTRARTQLVLTCSASRPRQGKAAALPPSRFLAELPDHLLRQVGPRLGQGKPSGRQLSLF